MSSNSKVEYVKKELPASIQRLGYILSIVGLVLVVLSYLVDADRAAFNNVILYTFIASIGVGSLFLVYTEYLSGAVWSTAFRRISEFLSYSIYILPLLLIPVFFNIGHIFHWLHPEPDDKILAAKAPYLNIEFFVIRTVAFILIWILFQYLVTKNSKKQDTSLDQNLTTKNIRLSAVFMPFFAITISFTAIDYLMSLEPHWFSTIFGVYYFSGTMLAGLASVTIIVVYLNERGLLIKGLTNDHYYSLGALMFAFTNFWAYIAFSQYLLIWYANLPEETFWFLARWEGGWQYITIGLIIVKFAVPYIGLLSQPSKMNPKRLVVMSAWILFAHYYDLYWLAMPNYNKGHLTLGWNELGFPILAVGLVILVFTTKAKNNNLVPIGDPKIKRGLDFRL